MIEVATVDHFARLELQPTQTEYKRIVADADYVRALVDAGCTAIIGNGGRVLGLGGLIDQGGGRAHAWCLLSNRIGVAFVTMHRAALRVIESSPYRRIEMVTLEGFCPAQRWAQQLGFEPEGLMRAWFPNGAAGMLWSKVRV